MYVYTYIQYAFDPTIWSVVVSPIYLFRQGYDSEYVLQEAAEDTQSDSQGIENNVHHERLSGLIAV